MNICTLIICLFYVSVKAETKEKMFKKLSIDKEKSGYSRENNVELMHESEEKMSPIQCAASCLSHLDCIGFEIQEERKCFMLRKLVEIEPMPIGNANALVGWFSDIYLKEKSTYLAWSIWSTFGLHTVRFWTLLVHFSSKVYFLPVFTTWLISNFFVQFSVLSCSIPFRLYPSRSFTTFYDRVDHV